MNEAITILQNIYQALINFYNKVKEAFLAFNKDNGLVEVTGLGD